MEHQAMRPRLAIGGVPLHAMIVPFPIASFVGAMITDIIYAQTAEIQWANFSAWLLAFGCFMGGIAALGGLIDYFGNAKAARPAIGLWHGIINIFVLLLGLLNSFVHARDGWTSVVPTGLTLSVITVLLLTVSGFLGHRMAYTRVGRTVR